MKNEEKNQNFYVGIDVSKLSLDVSIITERGEHHYEVFENALAGYKLMYCWLNKIKDFSIASTLFCMEHTGVYTRQLVNYLLQKEALIWMESALHLKRCMGMTRGKTDKVDSYRIARYAMTNRDKARLLKMNNKTIQKLKDLIVNRERIMSCIYKMKVAQEEITRVDKEMGKELKKINDPSLKGLKKSKEKVETRMMELIESDEELNKLFKLAISVKCVGPVLATELLVYTEGFTRMTTTRQLACYCGVAPFEHSSGTSVRGRTGTSNFANMRLKSTLHMAAVSACNYVPELKQYFERKVKEGKHKMSVMNAIRNKLLNRVMSVIKRGTPYTENFNEPKTTTAIAV